VINDYLENYCNYAADVFVMNYGAQSLTHDYYNNEIHMDVAYRYLQQGLMNSESSEYVRTPWWQEAREYAENGGYAIIVSDGHVATLLGGHITKKDEKENMYNLRIIQAGKTFGEMRLNNGFIRGTHFEFYIWKKK